MPAHPSKPDFVLAEPGHMCEYPLPRDCRNEAAFCDLAAPDGGVRFVCGDHVASVLMITLKHGGWSMETSR
jgi:hypothetical protein